MVIINLLFYFEDQFFNAKAHKIQSSGIEGYDYLIYQTDEGLLVRFGRDHRIVQWREKEKKTTPSQYPGDKDAINLMGCLENAVRAYLNKTQA